jgi:hypothetical protein
MGDNVKQKARTKPKNFPREKWVWMPHAGHFILGSGCRFRLNTYVGGYIVSTVGEYLPDSRVREIYAQSRGIKLEGMGDAREYDWLKKNGYEELGVGRTYETMVFKAQRSPKGEECCPWRMVSGSNEDFGGYSDASAAYAGHLKMCAKWSKR